MTYILLYIEKVPLLLMRAKQKQKTQRKNPNVKSDWGGGYMCV